MDRSRTLHRTARFGTALALAVALTLISAAGAHAISRDEVLARAQRRVDAPVPYSQARYYAGYRTDCSGYVSMCWATGTSWATRSFYVVTHPIKVNDLKPGDAMLKAGYHIRLFYGWLDAEHTTYVAYESAYGKIAGIRIHSMAEDLAFGYIPVRYDRITDSPAPRSVLKNGSFNTWAMSWAVDAYQPVWWDVEGPAEGVALATLRKDTYKVAANSLQLDNPSDSPDVVTELAQSAPVVGGVDYRATAWVKTGADPAALRLRVTYLDAAGEPVAEADVSGDSAGLVPGSFGKLTLLLATPPQTTSARVSVVLGGGSSPDASGTVVAGTSAIVDEVSLARPQVGVSIKTSRTTAYSGTKVDLYGAVSPTESVGTTATVYVARPGGSWRVLRSTPVTGSASAATWKTSYSFSRSMPRGTYRFKIVVPALPGYLGATSSIVSVRKY